MTDKRILIGEISTVHGIKGLVKVRSFVEDETLFAGKVFTEETGSKTIKLIIKNALKGDWLAEANGITDRNEAEKLRGTQLYVDRDALPEANDGEYYIEDLKGMKVVDENGKDIGTVLSIENFGASDLIDIKPATGSSFYLPFTDDVEVDADNGIIKVTMPEIV